MRIARALSLSLSLGYFFSFAGVALLADAHKIKFTKRHEFLPLYDTVRG